MSRQNNAVAVLALNYIEIMQKLQAQKARVFVSVTAESDQRNAAKELAQIGA
jgi:hypothetical protein